VPKKHLPSLTFALCAGVLGLSLACGGSASKSQSTTTPAPNTTPQPPQKAVELPEPFWASDVPVRPGTQIPSAGASNSAVMRLSDDELAAARASKPETPSASAEVLAAVQTRTVVGLRSFIYHRDDGTTNQPINLTTTIIQALVPNGSGGFTTIAGVGHDDGTFSIKDVPEGFYWLRFGTTYVWTNSNFIDWSFDTFGRNDVNYPGTSPTNEIFNLTNLAAWQDTDGLFLSTPNHGIQSELNATLVPGITNAPTTGATALTNYTMDLTVAGFFGLLDATKNDQSYLTQLTRRTDGAFNYRGLAKCYVTPLTTMTDGAPTTFTSGFLDIPQTSNFRFNWQRASFIAFAPNVNPSATYTNSFLTLYAFPLSSSYGLSASAFTLLDYSSTSSGNLDAGDRAYGNPFPLGWTVAVDSYTQFSVSYLAPGATTAAPLNRFSYQASTTLPTATSAIVPLCGPFQNIKINGKDFFQNQVSVGLTPTISWTAPAVGSANGASISLYELKNNAGATQITRVASFRTNASSLSLPSGVMVAGKTYLFTLAAIRSNGVNLSVTPFKTSMPYAFTTSMGAIVTP
jgi:hypothetical protein